MVLLTVYVSVKVQIAYLWYCLFTHWLYFEVAYFGIAYRKYNGGLHEYRNYSVTILSNTYLILSNINLNKRKNFTG